MTKYAIPTDGTRGWDEIVCSHFGRSAYYAIWDDETNELEFIANESEHFGGRGMPAEFLADKCNCIICSGIGSRAIALCNQLGLSVYVGANGTIRETIEAFKAGRLTLATEADGCGGSQGKYRRYN